MREEDLRSLMFGDYMNPDAEPEERVYDEVKSLEEMYKIVEQCLEEYNNTHKNRMNLVIFRSAGNVQKKGEVYFHQFTCIEHRCQILKLNNIFL